MGSSNNTWWDELPKNVFPRCSPWRKQFALWPVTVHGERVWLKYYYVRVVTQGFNQIGNPASVWEYGTIFDVLKEE